MRLDVFPEVTRFRRDEGGVFRFDAVFPFVAPFVVAPVFAFPFVLPFRDPFAAVFRFFFFGGVRIVPRHFGEPQ